MRDQRITYIIAILMIVGLFDSNAKETRREICVDFKIATDRIDVNYRENATRLNEIVNLLESTPQSDIIAVTFCGAASPEGKADLNRRLSHERMLALERAVTAKVSIPAEKIRHDDQYIPWGYLISNVKHSDLEGRDEAVRIMAQYRRGVDSETIVERLRQIGGGSLWSEISRRYFSGMRKSCAVVTIIIADDAPDEDFDNEPQKQEMMPIIFLDDTARVYTPTPAPVNPQPTVVKPVAPQPAPAKVDTVRHEKNRFYLRTNLLGWATLNANAAIEVDFGRRWSFAFATHGTSLDYFSRTLKFRTLSFRPEFRYWLTGRDGWFVGAHAAMTYFNFAFDGDYRYQDHNGTNPALGGGISLGYRKPIGKRGRWRLEFELGGGVYKLKYDKFVNGKNGALVGTYDETFYGVDNAAISIVYTFDRKHGRNAR